MNELHQRIDTFIETMERLTILLEAENKALAAHHPEHVAGTVDQKLLLSRTFERQMQQIGPLKSALSALPEKVRKRIATRAERFRATAAANQIAIAAAQRTAERLVGHIVEAVRKQTDLRPAHYARPNARPQRTAPGRISVSINQIF